MAGKIGERRGTPERLTKDRSSFLESKKIYFAGFSSPNIQYFLECFPQYLKNICGIFAILDIDERTPLTASVGEKTYKVMALKEVESLSAEDSVIIIMYEYEREAYEKILNILEDNSLPVYWFADRATEIELFYRNKYSLNPTENIILFKSGSRQYVYGDDFSDNARALFEYMIRDGYNKRWKLVWLVYDPASKDYESWKRYDNVVFIGTQDSKSEESKKKDLYYHYLCLAKYAFVTDDESFFRRRRGDQTLVQLWHGDGVKARTRFRRMESRWDYMVCTSQFYADSDQEVFGLRADQTLPCGLPKDDWTASKTDKTQSFEEEIKGFYHTILWAPTFRKSVQGLELLNENVTVNETGLPILATWHACSQINEILKSYNCILLVKLHPVADLSLHEGRSYSNIRLMTNQDLYSKGLFINHIMPYFEAFISDYSSAITSYMILDRPMAFTLDDLNEYDESRGFVLNPVKEYLPGKELYTVKDMIDFIEDVCRGKDITMDKRRRLMSKMIDYRDGKSSERLLEILAIEK